LALEASEPYIWLVSDTKHQACSHLGNLKEELEQNPLLAQRYPLSVGRGPVWRQNVVTLRNGVAIEAFGTGQRIRGRKRGAHRPTVIICDDLQNDSHMESVRQRDISRRWFHGTLIKAGTKRTNIINLATALHRDALAPELCRTPGWTSRVFRAIEVWPDNMLLWEEWEAIYCDLERPDHHEAARAFYEQHRDAMDFGAVLLWPAEEDLYTLMCARAEGGRAAFEREKQGSPINPESCEWPDSYFDATIWFDEWPQNVRLRTMALDPSKGGDSRRGDYSAYVLLAVDTHGVLYVEADLARRPTPQMVADGVELYRRFRPDAFGIESNQFQELLAPAFTEEFARQGLLGVAPWMLDNRTNKLVRIRRLGPYLASHRLRFKAHSPSTALVVEQLKMFPVADHDDGPDALEMAIRLAGELINGRPTDDGLGERLI
jgi:predicted phage terminase large subunit-like protein